ncbi:MAG: hypothetical protein AAB457_03615 [Patescibacteria group bacterium]
MKSLTLHNIDDVLYQRLVEIAADQNLSLNTTAKSVLGDSLGLTKKKRDLSWLFSKKWTAKETTAFDKAIADTEKIDAEDWK